MREFAHFACIDWSGATTERLKGIAVAICDAEGPPRLVRPERIWSRADVRDWLLRDMPMDTLVGLDLGISLPFADCGAYFPIWRDSPADARALWRRIDEICADDAHFAASAFVDHPDVARHLRRQGKGCGDQFGDDRRGRFRRTELAQAALGCRPYSNFNLVGAAQVGKSSLTGMRVLHALARRVPVWPMDDVPDRGSLIVEIYTSIAAIEAGRTAARTKMRSWQELNELLDSPAIHSARISPDATAILKFDDHRSDSLLTAAWLRRAARRTQLWDFAGLDAVRTTEGWTFGAPGLDTHAAPA